MPDTFQIIVYAVSLPRIYNSYQIKIKKAKSWEEKKKTQPSLKVKFPNYF